MAHFCQSHIDAEFLHVFISLLHNWSMKEPTRIETKLIHAGEPHPRIGGAVALPIFQSSTFEYGEEIIYEGIKYIRMSNTPNHLAVQEKIAALENAEAASISASGMASISATFLALLKPGDHLLAQNCLYGAAYTFITHDLRELGISVDFVDANDPATWAAKLKPNTKLFYLESLSNPLLEIPDLAAAAAFARKHGIKSVIDNTFASPLNFRPLDLGFDLSIHSCTKYLNGHSDLLAGAVVGSRADIEPIAHKLVYLGGCLDPHACFLLHRGMKTLAVRLRFQNESTLQIARALERHPQISQVIYPGLESHPQHARAKELFQGSGGVLSFRPRGGVVAAEKLVRAVTIPIHAPSLGGVESLITRPAVTTHAKVSPAERARIGITDDLIRLSVGLESPEDLITDLSRALR